MSNKVLNVMMSTDEGEVDDLHNELEEMRVYLLQEHDFETPEFLLVLQVEFNCPCSSRSKFNSPATENSVYAAGIAQPHCGE